MKKILIAAVFALGLAGSAPVFAQDFDGELSALRGKIIPMCAQLQAGKPNESPEQLLGEIDAVIAAWDGLAKKYTAEVPAAYAKDPEWKNYFSEGADNFSIMRQKAAAGDYKRAMHFCGLNCALFVKIKQVNGRAGFSDRLFFVRQNARLALLMAKADNWNDAIATLGRSGKMLEEIKTPEGDSAEAAGYAADLKTLKADFAELSAAFGGRDMKKLGPAFAAYLAKFGKIYTKRI